MKIISRDQLLNCPAATHHTKSWSGVLDPKQAKSAAVNTVLNLAIDGHPHEPQYLAFSRFSDAKLILDVGANCGQSIVAFRRIGLACTIRSFEPERTAFDIARSVGEHFSDVFTLNFGLSDRSRNLLIYTPVIDGLLITPLTTSDRDHFNPGEPMHSFLTQDIAKGANVMLFEQEIEVKRGDELRLTPDIIKIDVEGAELAVLEGLQQTIVASKPSLMIEKSDAVTISSRMVQAGYSAYKYEDRPGPERCLSRLVIDATVVDSSIPVNIIYIHQDRIGKLVANGSVTLQ